MVTTDSYKYDRQFSLTVTTGSKTFDFSDFRVTFQVTHGSVATPKTLRARIYNVSHGNPDTVAQIQQATNKTVTLSAYYKGAAPSVLFYGEVRQVYYGRESPVDTYLDLGASVNEKFFAEATVNQVLQAGWTHEDVFRSSVMKANAPYGVRAGKFPANVKGSGIRPRVVYGNARDQLRSLGRNTSSVAYNDDDGTHNFESVSATASGAEVDTLSLTPFNGLINIPIQVPEGIHATCLMESRIRPGSRVEIYSANASDSNTTVTQESIDLAYTGLNSGNQVRDSNGNLIVVGLSHTGQYTVLWVDHFGDTRGSQWLTTFVGQAVDPSDLPVLTSRAAGTVP